MENPEGRARQTYFPEIDSLRFVAAFLVLLSHSIEHFGISHGELGRLGIILFFLISGFVNGESLRRDKIPSHFMVKRFFRLYPAFLASIAGAVLIYGTNLPKLLCNLTMLPSMLGQPELIGVYWTLEVEIVFYASLLIFTQFWKIDRAEHIAGAVLAFCLAGLIWQHLRTANLIHPSDPYRKFLAFIAIIYCGALFRIAHTNPSKRWMSLGMAVLALGCLSFPSLKRPLEMSTYWIALAAFLWVIHYKRRGPNFLSWGGKISYSIYLFHGLVLSLLIGYVNFTWTPTALFVAALVGAIAIGAIVYYAVEKPTNRLGHFLVQKIMKPKIIKKYA
jgi:peptidoglycan/LPS O-acetylase OafA/YrhL